MALNLPAEDPMPEGAATYFDKCEEKLGIVPNVLVAHAFDAERLDTFAKFYNSLMLAPSGLTKAEREMIAVTVSAINRCHYCLTAHGAALRQLTGDPALAETITQNWRAADLSERQRAMLAFVEKLSLRPAAMDEADRQALRDAGFSDRDIFDIASVAGFYAMSNRLASATEMAPNPEYHAMARD
ncbi:alkylhydroperoxidase [Notoacmeibacter ruber]|uniref:Alkylhydroperoxidase n=2 Tax=Notoacmeibacter ruber TaxID=2670375 RepID=A0A3L7JM24_9HYPH|nr:peroxidase-related enzyme [Notoacmeibacter ruber]RLQ89602.1 alkylhydroperoxidase [Notoacmeibacter ruber]